MPHAMPEGEAAEPKRPPCHGRVHLHVARTGQKLGAPAEGTPAFVCAQQEGRLPLGPGCRSSPVLLKAP